MGAERIIAMSRHEKRQQLAKEFGATEIVSERGEEGVMAIHSTRPGGYIGYVGVPHGMTIDFPSVFFNLVHLHGGPAPVHRFLPDLIRLVWERTINPGKVFDLSLPLDRVAEAYRAMDERQAIKALLRPSVS